MRLKSLQLYQFKSWSAMAVPLEANRVLFVGRNGVGKTSIREAVRWALRGVAQGTDAKGAGAEVLAPTGQKDAKIAVAVDGLGTVTREHTKFGVNLAVEGFTGTSSAQQAALYQRLNATPEYLDALLDSSAFLRLAHQDAKALVLALLNVRISIPGHETPYTLDELDRLYDQAFEARKLAKRDLKNLPVLPEPVPPEGGILQLDAIEAQLVKLRDQAQALAQQVGGASATRAGAQETLRRAQAAVTQWQKALAAVGDPEPVRARVKALEAEIKASVRPNGPAVAVADEPEGGTERIVFLRNRMEALGQHRPNEGCVLDPDVRCDTPKQQFNKRVKVLGGEIEALEKAAGDIWEPPANQGRDPLAELEAAKQQMRNYDTASGNIALYSSHVDAAQNVLGELPTDEKGAADLEALRERIARGEQLQRLNQRYHLELTTFRESQQKVKDKQAEIATLEQTVDALGPNGLRVSALAAQLDRFTGLVNSFTEPFGWKVTFVLEPWGVLVNGRPIETYSKSEQYRIGIAIQLAVAALSGVGFAVIDELDMLDTSARNSVGRLIHAAPLDQIIVLQTREDDAALPKLPGWLVYRVGKENGTSRILEVGQA